MEGNTMSKQAKGFIWGILLCLVCLVIADWAKNKTIADRNHREPPPEKTPREEPPSKEVMTEEKLAALFK
jgi:hypothetical protein